MYFLFDNTWNQISLTHMYIIVEIFTGAWLHSKENEPQDPNSH